MYQICCIPELRSTKIRASNSCNATLVPLEAQKAQSNKPPRHHKTSELQIKNSWCRKSNLRSPNFRHHPIGIFFESTNHRAGPVAPPLRLVDVGRTHTEETFLPRAHYEDLAGSEMWTTESRVTKTSRTSSVCVFSWEISSVCVSWWKIKKPNNLVGGWPTPLKNMSSSDWIIIPSIGEKNQNVPNHQPVMFDLF